LTLFYAFTESHESVQCFNREQNELLYEKLKEIVEKHEKAIEMCRKMSQCLSFNIFIHLLSGALVTCICALMILLAEGAEKLIFVNYIVASTCQIFVYCYGGELLVDSSTKIQLSAYNFEWHKCDIKIRKLIHMIIIRAQRKSAVDVPFFQASLETFGSVSFIGACVNL
jgi:hypothetical protein